MTKTNTKNETKNGKKSLKKTQSEVTAMKVTNAKPPKKYRKNIKRTDVPSQNCERRRCYVQLYKAALLLHHEGMYCDVEVPSTRGSHDGEPPPQRQPP